MQGSCEPTDQKTTLAASVRISVSVLRGPAMHGREADVPVFLAVVQGDTVRDKRVFPVHIRISAERGSARRQPAHLSTWRFRSVGA